MGCGICGGPQWELLTDQGVQACRACYYGGESTQRAAVDDAAAANVCTKCRASMDPALSHRGPTGAICQSCALQSATLDAEVEGLELETDGSFWLGFAYGMFGNMIGLAIVYQRGGSDTKRGAAWGMGAAMCLVLIMFVGLSLSTGGR